MTSHKAITSSILFLPLLLSACIQEQATKPYSTSDFRNGRITLTCETVGCTISWGASTSEVRNLYKTASWDQLARRVASENYSSNLAYFYLGQAAEGIGAYSAARTYYQKSKAAKIDCSRGVNVCQGIDVKESTNSRLAVLASYGNSKPAPVAHHMDIREAQSILYGLGYYKGAVDGLYGPKTEKAIRDYQSSVGLPETGIIDELTRKELAYRARTTPQATEEHLGAESFEPEAKGNRSPDTQEETKANPSYEQQAAILRADVELLKSADPFADAIASIKRGSEVTVISSDGQWTKIQYKGKLGYIYSDQIR